VHRSSPDLIMPASTQPSPPSPSSRPNFAALAARLEEARATLWQARIPLSPQAPTPPQGRFLALECREALYGGAAGGGKSSALLMAALQYAHVPGYAAIIFRRTFADLALPGAIMDRAKEWLVGRPGVQWNDNDKRFTFDCGGGTSTLTFGYLDTDRDRFRYQGAEFQFIGWDELTQFPEASYRYLISRLRRLAGSAVPLRMRAASNPGGVGHEWVRQRFIVEGPSQGRVFVPARLTDNPHLDRTEYEKSLAELDPVTRAQLLDGDWEIVQRGPMFDRAWFEIVDAAPEDCRWVRYWDLAATEAKAGKDPDWTAGARVGMTGGVYFIADMRRLRGTPRTVEDTVRQTAELDGKRVQVVIEQEPGSAGLHTIDHYQRRVLVGWAVTGDRKTGSKAELAKPLSAAAQAGNVKIVRGPWVSAFLDEIHAFPTDGVHDDQVDAAAGGQRFVAENPVRLPAHAPVLPRRC
jgi:predicted phage terminase large subunit-like protein